MNETYKIIIELLAAELGNNNIVNDGKNDLMKNQFEFFEECSKHQIIALIYYIVNKHSYKKVDSVVILNFRKLAIVQMLNQKKTYLNSLKVLDILSNKKVQVIVLKGLVLREYYPKVELRMMSDIDLLIEKSNLKECIDILEKFGYTRLVEQQTSRHETLYRKDFPTIDLHYSLSNDNILKSTEVITNEIWENKKSFLNYTDYIFAPSTEMHMLFLLIHMAAHLLNTGFGLRQLCDFILFLDAHSDELLTSSFVESLKKYKLQSMFFAILCISDQYFMKNYSKRINYRKYVEVDIDKLMEYIINDGVFGKNSIGNVIIANKAQRIGKLSTIRIFKKMKIISSLAFPSFDEMRNKYEILNTKPYLLFPMYLRRLFTIDIKDDKGRIKYFVDEIEQKKKLFKDLELIQDSANNIKTTGH